MKSVAFRSVGIKQDLWSPRVHHSLSHSYSRSRRRFVKLSTQGPLKWVWTKKDKSLTSTSLVIQRCLSRISLLCLSENDIPRSASWRVCHACKFDVKCLTLLGRVPQDAIPALKALTNIIQSSIVPIEEVTTADSFTFPSPDSTFIPETKALRMHPAIQSAGSLIVSAAAQLMTLVRPAPLTLLDISTQVSRRFLGTTVRYC